MLYIEIQGEDGIEEYKLYFDNKRYMKLKKELLSRFKEDTLVTVTDKGAVKDVLKLGDMFGG